MKTLINDFKSVIIKGDADNVQQARVFLILFIPAITMLLVFGHLPKY